MTSSEIDPSELYFLILHYLAAGPCNEAAKTLEEQAVANGLLPCRHDVFGTEHRLTYSDLQHMYAHIVPDALPRLLQHALAARRASTTLNLEGDRSLLTSGAQHGQANETKQTFRLQDLSLCHKQVLREQGQLGSPERCTLSSQQRVQQVQHHMTIRGHKLAVYCVAFDKAGRHIITGSDDRLVKIWSTQTALLLRSCRGHDGEVTDLAINRDNTMVASSSNDTTIRCWSLEWNKLGHPVSVLVGHQGPVTYVDFNKTIPNALLSSSFDGTCRIWDATNSAWPAKVMQACPLFGPMKGITRFGGTAGPFPAGQANKPNTRSLDASATARSAAPEGHGSSVEHRLRSSDVPEAAGASAAPVAGAFNEPEQSTDQTGLLVCGFSPDGSHIVAGSSDCHIYAWFWDIAAVVDKGKAAAKQGFYNVVSEEDAARNLAPAAAVDLEAVDWPEPQETCRLGGHVNDVLLLQFSHDGQSIATGSKDGTMRTWQRVKRRNKVLNSWENKHVLKCELDDAAVRKAKQKRRAPPVPAVNQLAWSHDDMLVISSVSDHTIRVWDSHTGLEVQRLVGHEAQVHILECHPVDHRLAMSASYDGTTKLWNLYTGQALASFSTRDTRPDVHGSWVDHTQLVDGHWSPDGSSLVVSDVAGQWHLYSVGAPSLVRHARYDQFLESDYDRLTRDVNNAVIDDNTQQPPHLRPTRDYLVDYVAGRYAEPYQSAYRSDQVLQLPLKVAQGEGEWDTTGLPQALREYPPTVTAAGWMAQEAEGTDEDIDRAIQRAMQRAIAAEAALAAAVVAGEVDLTAADSDREEEQAGAEANDQVPGGEGTRVGVGTRRSAPMRSEEDAAAEDDMEEAEEWEQWQDGDVDISSSDGHASGSDDSMYSEGAGGARTRAQRRARRTDKRPRPSPDHRGQRARKRQRLQRSQYAVDVSDDEEEELDQERQGQDVQRLLRSHRASARRADGKAKKQQKKKVRRQTGRAQAGAVAQGGRPLDKYAWLQVSWRTPGVYVPQLGDQVVYLQVGHRKFLSHNSNKLQGPWDSIASTQAESRGQRMREVEPACVTAINYIISDDGTSNTCAKLRLQLDDPNSPLEGRSFDVELPPPNCGHAEFVIPRHRFLASVHRKWQRGDCCQVFYPDEDSEAAATCEAWHGDVTDVLSHDRAGDGEEAVQADPYGCGGLWERFMVGWQPRPQVAGAHDNSDEDDSTEPTHQSPWELFDEGLDAHTAAQEGPALDSPVAERLKHAVQILSASELFEVFVDLLEPDAAYPASDTGALMYYNTMVPLPMSLSLIRDRLEQGYYRQVQGVMGDVASIEGNARAFNGEDSQVADLAADLARRLTAAGQGADYEAGLTSDDAEISDLDQASQGSHPESEGPAGDDAQEGRQDDEGDEEEEEVDIMNSPLQPWGPDVRTSRRSNRSRRWFGSPIPADSTAVLRDPPQPHPSPAQPRLRRSTRPNAAADDAPGPSRLDAEDTHHGAHVVNGHAAAVRQTRSRRGESKRVMYSEDHDDDLDDWERWPSQNGASAVLPQQQQQQSHGRSLRSRKVNAQEPSTRGRLDTEDDARLASEWQEAYDKEHQAAGLRRSTRTHAQASSQPAKSEEASAAAAGPSQPASSLSPVSTRETRAQNRSLRGQQTDSFDKPDEADADGQHGLLRQHQASAPPESPGPAPAAAAGPSQEGQAVRRSSRAHTRAASVSIEAEHKAAGASQGSTGIKVTLKPSSSGAARHDAQTDVSGYAPTTEGDNGRRSGLRVSLRPRRA